MTDETADRAVAIVGVGAVMPDAPDAASFWSNITGGRYSISDVPTDRWDPDLYFDPDPHAPEKTYSKIGGWVRGFEWNPLAWRLPIPPLVSAAMDEGQQWAVACTRAALVDAGWPERPLDHERTAVIFGNAMAGEKHYVTAMRINFPEFARVLESAPSFAALPREVRAALLAEAHERMLATTPPITEDTMPGELGNVLAGRIANIFDFRGPNFITDAACASALAALSAGVEGLVSHEFDAVVTGGIDRNMGAASFVKFCKIGALSATGTRPYADGADGFVMGEGAAVFLLKRLADAERDGDRVYAVLRGVAGSSDGKGKGITAPNPVGQRLSVERAWRQAGLSPATATMVEGHGTSTRVGDVAEVEGLISVFGQSGAAPGSIALGSVKSNIGHLKAAAGAAGLFKVALALHHKVLPPSLNFAAPNPNIDFASSPFRVNTELREWAVPAGTVRTAGLSAFGFGGTNFHAVLEEYVPGRLKAGTARTFAVSAPQGAQGSVTATAAEPAKPPLRGLLVLGAADETALAGRLTEAVDAARAGRASAPAAPAATDLGAAVRIAIDFADPADLADKGAKALAALQSGQPALWRALRSRGVFLGRGPAPRTAFLFTGQGSQYVNMLKELRATEAVVAETFAEADRVMTPLLGRPLSDYIFVDRDDPDAVATLEQQLLQTEITQPAVLATDIALCRLLARYGVEPDMVMGHSLGEYAALVAAGALSFASALEAVSARGHEMASLSIEDNGAMAAVFAPLSEIERIVGAADGYVVVANVNSTSQAVIGGATAAVEQVVTTFAEAGYTAVRIPVSHAFHTSIVAPASEPLRATLARLELRAPVRPIVANVDGMFYPAGPDVDDAMLDILGRQVASPVQFVQGLRTLYDAGARVFVEVGPKKALHGFAEDVLGAVHDDVQALFTNHPKAGDVVSFNQALAGLYAAGLGAPAAPAAPAAPVAPAAAPVVPAPATASVPAPVPGAPMSTDRYLELGRLFADFLDRGREIMAAGAAGPTAGAASSTEPVVISGAGLGLPGTERVFDDHNVARLLSGEQFIDLIPTRFRHKMLDKHITRLVKTESGGGRFETIDDPGDVLKLAGRAGHLDVVEEYGVDPERDKALDVVTRLAIGAGFDALRDAGIPLVQHYRLTSLGTKLPSRWGLPEAMRDDTGVIFASAFPGCDSFSDELERHHTDLARRRELEGLQSLRARVSDAEPVAAELDHRIRALQAQLEEEPYLFDRRFLFRALSMGHSQFAEIIGARGPNTQVNAACASTTQALSLAEDWIRAGRCRRVIVVSADDVTSDHLIDWVGAGFLATGAAATDDVVENAALPFDNRRHGMIMGMGAAALVVESAEAARERGVRPICEVLSTVTANSAFHGTRLDVEHISQVMERLVSQAEARGVRRDEIAAETVFVSHETYTPARGGSAAAEINALRQVFRGHADRVVIANTKGYTGHAMGVGVEDVLAVKALETGLVPPIPNFKEVDPELGRLTLSTGGAYPIRYALRLAAGFGSQISMALLRWTPMPDGQRREPTALGYATRIVDPAAWQDWLRRMSGSPDPQLEVVQRRLRVVDDGSAAAPVAVPAAPAVPVAPAVPAAPVVPVAPAAPAAAAVPAAAAPGVDPVVAEVLAVVSEKTGYPVEMLDLDLDLE
nr:acyltransferase domain-containing protein [Actinomycetes bacterium]